MGPHDHLWHFGEGARRRARGRARCWSSHGQESGGADHPLPQGLGGRRQGWWFFRARRLGGQDPHARAGGRSCRATTTSSAVFWVLSLAILGGVTNSGDPTPSRADIQMTQAIIEVARPLGIAVHDHIIVAKEGHASLKALKLI